MLLDNRAAHPAAAPVCEVIRGGAGLRSDPRRRRFAKRSAAAPVCEVSAAAAVCEVIRGGEADF